MNDKGTYEIFSHSYLYQRKDTEDMAKGLTRCNVCGKTVEQVFEGQMLLVFMNVLAMAVNMMEVCLT